jgi:hypothetical protein
MNSQPRKQRKPLWLASTCLFIVFVVQFLLTRRELLPNRAVAAASLYTGLSLRLSGFAI